MTRILREKKRAIILAFLGSLWLVGTVCMAQGQPTLPTPLPLQPTPTVATLPTHNIKLPTPDMKVLIPSLSIVSTRNPVATQNVVPTHAMVPTPSVPREPIFNPYVYDYPTRESFVYPAMPVGRYPDLDISGFYEAKMSGRNYEPKIVTDSRFETIRRDPVYNKLPRDVLLGNPKLDLRYKFNIEGKLDKDLSVFYDVEQEPDFPGKYDIRVKYKNTDLTFYHFDVEFKDGEYLNVRKALNGAKITSYTDDWETTIATGKLRSQPQKYDGYGNGTRKINIGARSILEDSLKVWVNNVPQSIGRDYTVDLYQGDITFKDPKSQNDYIVAIYEFTNPIEDFIPVLNRKSFMGAQFLWRNKGAPKTLFYSRTVSNEMVKSGGATVNAEYQLVNFPVVIGSDTVRMNGRILRPNKDYFLKNQKGKLSFSSLLNVTKEDSFVISYDYYETEDVEETLIGKNSTGPYKLSHTGLLDGTEEVYVDSVKLNSIKDYVLDSDKGSLNFNYLIRYPSVISVQYKAIKSGVEMPTKNNAPLTLGVTYLTEYTQTQTDNLVTTVSSENRTVSDNTGIFYTANTPISSTSNLSITMAGVPLAANEYQLLNAYTGQIKILKPFSGPQTVVLSYSYRKSFRTNYVFQGVRGKADAYRNNTYEMTLRDVPVKYKGVAYIAMSSSTLAEQKLTEGVDYLVQYGDPGKEDGTAISIRFLLANDNTGSRLQSYPDETSRITLVYDYTPPDSPNQGNVSQKMMDVTMGLRLSKEWSLNTEIALSDNNFSKQQKDFPKEVSLVGNAQANYAYDIGVRNIVENSESVFLGRFRQTKDVDYYINYVLGTIRFINKIPGTQDQIVINGKYYDTGGQVAAGKSNLRTATKIKTTYETQKLSVKGDVKVIDKDFLPIGDFNEKKGSVVYGGSVDLKLDQDNKVNGDYHHRDIYSKVASDGQKQLYLRSDEIIGGFNLTNVLGLFDTEESGRILLQAQDPDPARGADAHESDSYVWEYTGRFLFGPDSFRNTLTGGLSKRVDDYIDNVAPVNTGTLKTRFDNKTNLRSLFILGDTNLYPYYEYSQADSEEFTATQNRLVRKSLTYEKRSNMGVRTDYHPFPFLPINAAYDRQEIRNLRSGQPTESLGLVTNSSYDASFTPFSWFSGSISARHSESESPLVNQKGTIEDVRSYQVSRFLLHQVPSLWGVPETVFWLAPLRGSGFSYGHNESVRFENNNMRSYNSFSDRYAFGGFEPIEGLRVANMAYENGFSTNSDLVGSSVASKNLGSSQTFKKEFSGSLSPKIPILNLFSYSLGMEDRSTLILSQVIARSVTSSRLVDSTPYFRRTQQVSFSPGNVILPLWLINLDLGRLSASVGENYEDKNNTKTTFQNPTLNVANEKQSAIVQDNSFIKQYTAKLDLTPFNIFSLGATGAQGYERYSRNLTVDSTGTTHKNTLSLGLTGDYSPFSFLRFSSNSQYSLMTQYRSGALGIPLEQMESALSNAQFSTANLVEFIRSSRAESKLDVTTTPLTWFSLVLGGGLSQTIERAAVKTSDKTNRFNQTIGSSGWILRPFTGLNIAYTYSLKLTDQDGLNKSEGYSGVTNVAYLPIQTDNFKVSISYTREDAWGKQLNTLNQQLSQQGNGFTLQTVIEERDDTVETASLNIDIAIPITDSPYLDKLVVSGEGYLKKISDRRDPFNTTKKSYEISGFYLKGTLLF